MDLVIIALILANIVTFILPSIIDFSGGRGSSYNAFLQLGWNSAADIRDGEYYRLLSSMFLHADIFHLAINMYSLFVVGPTVIFLFGLPGFAIIYLLAGIGGSLTSSIFNPKVPSVGASGAIFGLVGALLVFAILTQQLALIGNIVFVIILNAFIGFSSQNRIDNLGHFGGFLSGAIAGLLVIFLAPFLGL